jgi:hypothetical protein
MDIAIIGGGASGLLAAVTAAESGHRVMLFERQARVGRKLLSTGNGRCNISNKNVSISRYHGENTEFIRPALTEFSTDDAMTFFRNLGLVTVTEPDGKIYPFSDQAGSVVDVLRFTCDSRGVETITGCQVSEIKKAGNGFNIITDNGKYIADKVIVCCGGCAGGKLGGTTSGYELLEKLGHTRTKLYPALVQLKTDATYIKSLKGVRADCGVSLMQKSKVIAESCGEVQFTEYGLSGPAIFEISRAATVAGGDKTVKLDLMKSMSEGEVSDYIFTRKYTLTDLTLENLLTGLLHNRLGRTVIRYAGLDLNTPVEELSDRDALKIAHAVKHFETKVLGNMGFDNAQVTAGGIKTDEFDPNTLESNLIPGLYAAGEVLDIDGDCGGFNLQWAWASGRLAGRLR